MSMIVSELDLLPLIITFLGVVLWRADYGIILGIAANLIEILFLAARPSVYKEVIQIQIQVSCRVC